MSLNPKVTMEVPKRSNVPLSYINRFSASPGVLIPAYVQDTYKSDELHISVRALFKTLPLLGPLMGSFKAQLDFYEVPDRFYNPRLHDNTQDFDPFTTAYPYVHLTLDGVDEPVSGQRSRGVHPSSLMHYLGVPEEFLSHPGTEVVNRFVNGIPSIGYIDIVKNYYINTQEDNCYYMGYAGSPGQQSFFVRPLPVSFLDTYRQRILASDPTQNYSLSDTPPPPLGPHPLESEVFHYPMGGLFLRTHLPDRFNVWINNEGYAATLSRALVDVTSGSFNMDQLEFAKSMNRMLRRTLFSGRKYSDWSYSQYGGADFARIECPSFIGSISSEITFDDVIQTSSDTTGDDPLGTLGGRGVGGLNDRRLKHYCRENGYVIGIFSLIPRVSYYQGIRHWNRFRYVGDRHVPAMDRIGFQDLTNDDIYSANSVYVPTDRWNPAIVSVGKQPAWTELMTRVPEVHGEFARPDALMYLALVKRYDTLTSEPLPVGFKFSSYVNPAGFDYCFADASATSENFWCQFSFGVTAKRAISKRVF